MLTTCLRSSLFYGLWVFVFSCVARQAPNLLHLAIFAYAYKPTFLVFVSALDAVGAGIGGGLGFLIVRKFKHLQWHIALLGLAHVALSNAIQIGLRSLPLSTQYFIGGVLPRGENGLIVFSGAIGLLVVGLLGRLIRAKDGA